jgi:hypothetical protein
LIRPKPRATRPSQCQSVVSFLEPVFHVAALTRDSIDGGRRLAQIRHHETGSALRVLPWPAHDLAFDDHATAMRPTLGRIEGLPVDVLRAAAVFRQAVGLAQQASGAPLQPRVAGQPHDLLDPFGLQEVQPVVPREAPIHANAQRCLRERPRRRRRRVRRRPVAPRFAGLFPGRRTIATRYGSASSLNVSVAASGREHHVS